jgi:hypothetical protein
MTIGRLKSLKYVGHTSQLVFVCTVKGVKAYIIHDVVIQNTTLVCVQWLYSPEDIMDVHPTPEIKR